jgi:DNA mismatch endonuclease, patch repair protein
MADVFTKTQRSLIMGRIRGRDNATTELRVAGLLRAAKISGWRRHSLIFGKPDFVFRTAKVALFVDGCFWHGCPRCYYVPKSSAAFWKAKVQRNMLRDRKVSRQLRKNGWKVTRVWECRLETPARFLNRLRTLVLNSSADDK